MSDIVERLRTNGASWSNEASRDYDQHIISLAKVQSRIAHEAADEIERLRTRLAEAESRGRGQGMAVAAGIVCNGYDQPGIATEILGAAGLTTVADMRKCEVDPYDVKLCRPALKEFRARRAARAWKEASND